MRQSTSKKNPECPAIAELANTLEASFPEITLLTTNDVSPGTRHTAGLAIDIMLDVTNTEKRKLAHGIIDAVVKRHASMLWSDLIYSDYDGKTITYFHIPARGGFGGPNGLLKRNPYTEDTRHGDHIHLDWVDFSLKNVGQEYQRIPYKWSQAAKTAGFRGELSQDFSALAAGQETPASTGVVFSWLPGWWKVIWRGETFYYFFERASQVKWTSFRPVSTTHSIAVPRDTGAYTCATGNAVTIRWGATGSVETFQLTTANEMKGTWNGSEPLTAEKL